MILRRLFSEVNYADIGAGATSALTGLGAGYGTYVGMKRLKGAYLGKKSSTPRVDKNLGKIIAWAENNPKLVRRLGKAGAIAAGLGIGGATAASYAKSAREEVD